MIQIFALFFLFNAALSIAAVTNPDDYSAIVALKSGWRNVPPSWASSDPCDGSWEGIQCINGRVVSITLGSMGLSGQLTGDISGLSELHTLDLSYNQGLTGSIPEEIGNLKKLTSLNLIGCGFSGPIPDSIGSLPQLVTLSLNMNKFIGSIPASIGSLSNLYWLDLSDNRLSGNIPVSTGNTSGLDMLAGTKHFHFGNNQISGRIPDQLFNAHMSLIHVLFDNNQLIGTIPPTIGLVKTLEVVRFDSNQLTGLVPSNISQLSNVQSLYLSNNGLGGPLPDLTGLNYLSYLDLSNNTFAASDVPPWISTLQSLTTLIMENTRVQGQIPNGLFSLPQMQSVILRNNQLNGTLTIQSNYSKELQLIDLQNNSIDSFTQKAGGFNVQIILSDNPICGQGSTETYCLIARQANSSYSTPQNCLAPQCKSDQVSSPTCHCAYPYTGVLYFRAVSFSDLGNSSVYASLQQSLMFAFKSSQLPVDSVSLSNPMKNLDSYLALNLEIFPSGQYFFNRTAISAIGFVLSNQTLSPPASFGPYFFNTGGYQYFTGVPPGSKKSTSTGVIIGAAVGGVVLVLLLALAGLYALRQKRRAEHAAKQMDPFASWDADKNSGAVPELKGARSFTFEELRKYTRNFSDDIGSGGYGKVYRGTLPNGKLVAIKRAQLGSTQGALEFKTEIELLSRVHHKNVVSLVGFCFDRSEQMLVYEFIANGTLNDALSGKSGIRLDWMRRLRIAVGAARGIQYLHDLADPPIIHRDIKSNNILLDERLNAKVADFGLSKPADVGVTHVTTQVKGTMGYMDPEYYMTQQLTEKSDVYSFGIVLLELVTARAPIEKGKYIVREVKQGMDKTKDLYNLQNFIDPLLRSNAASKSIEKFVDLALSCVVESGPSRPYMSEVVKEIESIMELTGLNPNAESTSTSTTTSDNYNYGGGGGGATSDNYNYGGGGGGATSDNYNYGGGGGGGKGYEHPYNDESPYVYSGAYLDSKVEPK